MLTVRRQRVNSYAFDPGTLDLGHQVNISMCYDQTPAKRIPLPVNVSVTTPWDSPVPGWEPLRMLNKYCEGIKMLDPQSVIRNCAFKSGVGKLFGSGATMFFLIWPMSRVSMRWIVSYLVLSSLQKGSIHEQGPKKGGLSPRPVGPKLRPASTFVPPPEQYQRRIIIFFLQSGHADPRRAAVQ